jgi:hypothetical protein
VLKGFKKLLKAGRPRLKNYSTIVVVVLGGVTGREVRELEELERGFGIQVRECLFSLSTREIS